MSYRPQTSVTCRPAGQANDWASPARRDLRRVSGWKTTT